MNIYLKRSVWALTLVLSGAVAFSDSAMAREWTDGGDDVQLADAVRAALVSHGVPGAKRIRFQVLDHVVYLHGAVDTPFMSAEEMEIVSAVPGVKEAVDMTSPSNA
jgi:osmotically-inducible protein OsmY